MVMINDNQTSESEEFDPFDAVREEQRRKGWTEKAIEEYVESIKMADRAVTEQEEECLRRVYEKLLPGNVYMGVMVGEPKAMLHAQEFFKKSNIRRVTLSPKPKEKEPGVMIFQTYIYRGEWEDQDILEYGELEIAFEKVDPNKKGEA